MSHQELPKTDKRPVYIIYARKSKFTGKGESVQNQIDRCTENISSKFGPLSSDQILIFQDEGFSGGNINRPGFQEMMQLCRSRTLNVKAIVCYKLDRFSRSVSDFSIVYKEIHDELDIEFISVRDNFDTSTSMGEAMMKISTVFAELERNILAERIRDNKEGLAKTGRWLGGTPPTGYKSTRTEYYHEDTQDKKRTMCYLETVPDEKMIVQKIYHDYLETQSLSKVETILRLAGIKTKNNRYYTVAAIRAILTNPVYMTADENAWNYFYQNDAPIYQDKKDYTGQYGIMAYNKTEQEAHSSTKPKDMSDWIVSIGKHEPFISSKDWINVQYFIRQNAGKTYRSSKSSMGLLSGLLVCGNCGDYMRPKVYRRILPDGSKKFAYLCETKEKSRQHDCAMKNPPGNELDRLVCNEVKKLAEDKEFFIRNLEQITDSHTIASKSMQSNLDLLKQQKKDVDTEIQTLVQNLSSMTGAAVEYVNKQLNELDERREYLEHEIEYQKTIISQTLSPETELALIHERLADFAFHFDNMSFEEKRSTLKMIVKKIVWDGTNAHMFFIGDDSYEQFMSRESRAKRTALPTSSS